MKKQYTVLTDYRDGGNADKNFSNRESAIRFAQEELLWEATLFVSVLEENEHSEKEIFNGEGSFTS